MIATQKTTKIIQLQIFNLNKKSFKKLMILVTRFNKKPGFLANVETSFYFSTWPGQISQVEKLKTKPLLGIDILNTFWGKFQTNLEWKLCP